MARTAFLAVVGAALLAVVALGVAPELDLAASRVFAPEGRFWLFAHPSVDWLRQISMWPTVAIGVASLVAVLLKIIFPSSRMILPPRMAVFCLASVVLGPILVTNLVLKEHWERARPVHVQAFGGPWDFTPWWKPGDGAQCRSNCSFVSGEAAGAAFLVAPALLAPPQFRAAALAAAGVYTVVISGLRVAYGGHFLSDVILGALFTFLIVVWLHHWLYARAGAPTDEDMDRRLSALGDAAFTIAAGGVGAVWRGFKGIGGYLKR